MKDFGTLTDVKVPDGPYGVAVYQAAGNLAGAVRASLAIYNHKMIDIDEYEAEIERRRQIGLTIDPAIAETMFWWADMNDPYDILDERHHEGQSGREYFARNPGGEWTSPTCPKRRTKLSGSAIGVSWCSPTDCGLQILS